MNPPQADQTAETRLAPAAARFIDSVLALEARLAVFDCDGTLWKNDSGELFFYWEMERGLVSAEVAAKLRKRYDDYRAGLVGEEQMCGEMVTMHAGLRQVDLQRAAAEFFPLKIAPGIFREMKVLTERLRAMGCELWAVSSTNDWVVIVGAKEFGIPAERVLACSVYIENGMATDRLVRVPSDEGKALAIREVIGRVPDVAFGNSIHDAAMLEMAGHPFVVNPNPDLEGLARKRSWPIHRPGEETGFLAKP
ncbi:MAG TPA: haloacid dehalogenase-like hydrolase [Terriglobales bacterium]|nr:haloacid dehalogenase-like hydrolase [Terriglobales bacterium]